MTADQPVPDTPSTVGGRYRVLGELGRGNMGRVLRVSHLHTGETLAMKVLFVDRGDSAGVVDRFRREARSLGQIRSEHVVRVVDADIAPELGGAPYIVTELLEGEDLAHHLRRRGRLDPNAVVQLLHQVSLGLARVHEAGLVHRDLKPGNIFLHHHQDRVVVKLLDFGLVKVAADDDQDAVTHAGVIIGTPHFMSPEQVTGPADGIGRATDIWSVGILAFHLLTGRSYWNLREMPRGVFDIATAPLRPPSVIDPSLSMSFDAWFQRSCARNPAARWPDAVAQAQALAQALGEPPPDRRGDHGNALGTLTLSAGGVLTGPVTASAGGSVAGSGTPRTVPQGAIVGRQRRQVTVLVYRLVHTGGTAASMDPEEFEALEQRVYAALDEVLGDSARSASRLVQGGRLVFFGYPVAYGSDARRAVEAAQRLVATVAEWNTRLQAEGAGGLQVRVGVHTGVVLTGPAPDSRGAADVVGPALAVATDLEHDAAPGRILASEATWRLLGGRFEVRDAGEGRVEIVGASGSGEVAASGPAMVGRHLELGLLLSCLEAARGGEGQTVLVTGEVGIGKSRLLRALRDSPECAEVEWLECQCSPYFQNTPFHPLVGLVRGLFARALGHALPATLDRTASTALGEALGLDGGAVHNLASLASLSEADPSSIERLSPLMRRERTVHAIVALLHGRAAVAPVVLAVEDLHWADPSTLELLDELSVLRTAPLLTVLTARPDFSPTWRSPAAITPIQLRRLARPDVALLMAAVAARPLPPEFAEVVERATSGVPLFVEELTRLVSADDGASIRTVTASAVPTMLSEALLARLDRLGPARACAELAAVIGTEFTADDLAAAGAEGSPGHHLAELVRAGVLHTRGMPPRSSYVFPHALLRDAAYASLPTDARRAMHLRVARAMSDERRQSRPEVVAHHFAEGGLAVDAARLLQGAGQDALARSANAEARGHFERAIALVESPDPRRSGRPPVDPSLLITLRTLNGMAWVVSRGYAVPEAEANIAEAMARVRDLGDAETPALVPALWAQWLFVQVRGRPLEALEQSGRLLRLAERSGDQGVAMLGHLAEGTTRFGIGEFDEATRHLDLGLARYDAGAHASYRFIYGQDPWMLGTVFKAWMAWCVGQPDTAAAMAVKAVEHAQRLKHPNSIGFALAVAAIVHQYRGDFEALAATAQSLMTLSNEQGWMHWLGHARLWSSAAEVLRGEVAPGVAGMREARAFADQAGERSGTAHYDAVLIDGLCRIAAYDEAEARLAAANAELYERAFEPELLELEARVALGRGEHARARGLLSSAFATAANRKSLSHQLRAALALVRLPASAGTADDRARLASVVDAFTEGLETADLRAARAALDAV
jgi:class 3 adenylate cyclase/tetratricopeptide (TPR) repeat protein